MLTVNGAPLEVNGDMTLPDLLDTLNLTNHPCAVEVNASLVPHDQRKEFVVRDGDSVEVVTLVGGG